MSVLQKYKKVITLQGKQLKVLKLGGRVVLNIILFSLYVLQKSWTGHLKAVIENDFLKLNIDMCCFKPEYLSIRSQIWK